MDKETYDAFLRAAPQDCVQWQEEAGLDVLADGEFERNDMVARVYSVASGSNDPD